MKVSILIIIFDFLHISICGLFDSWNIPSISFNKFNTVTCLPCKLNICPGSTRIPVSEDVCDLAAGIGSSAPVDREDCFPAWMNLTKFQQGQSFFANHRGAIALLEIFALIGLLAFPELTDILLFTAGNACPIQAGKRYPSTMGQIKLWGEANILIPGNPCAVLNSINQVRNIHKHVARRVKKVANARGSISRLNAEQFKRTQINNVLWNAVKRDLEAAYTPEELMYDPCYIRMQNNTILHNQFAYTVTQWSFSAISSVSKERALLGKATDEDIDAFQHMWSVLGHILGIKDKYNIAIQPNQAARKAMYENFTMKYVVPALYNMDHQAKVLLELTKKRALNTTFFGKTFPSIPGELLALGMLRLILNIPYKNVYEISSPDVKIAIDSLDEQVKAGNPDSYTMDFQLRAGSDAQLDMWGMKYFGPCYNTWKTNCQIAEKLHAWYNGPDYNPNGTYSAKYYCSTGSSLSC